ncbi:hypothetical protein Tco_0781644 [Tanacetum coccineum]
MLKFSASHFSVLKDWEVISLHMFAAKLKHKVKFKKVYKAENGLHMPKGIKQSPLEKGASKVSREVHLLFLKGLYLGWPIKCSSCTRGGKFHQLKKRGVLSHIIGIEPQFENIISNGPFVPMAAGQRKPEAQWTVDERKATNLDQHLKSLIMSVLPDDQINSATRNMAKQF